MNSTLNSVDGNTLNLNPDSTDKDLYHCFVCDGYVSEDEWNNKRNQCFSCWWKI